MPKPTADTRIQRLDPLSPPVQVIGEAPSTSMIAEVVGDSRAAIHDILTGADPKKALDQAVKDIDANQKGNGYFK